MLLATIGNAILSKASGAAVSSLFDFFKPMIANEKAFRFARERLREKYEPLFLPASYDHVIEACRITHDDFVSYFKSKNIVEPSGIYPYLAEHLRARSESWVFNRPRDHDLENFFSEFIAEYEAYFYVHDQQLTTLYIASASRQTLDIVQSLREEVLALARSNVTFKERTRPLSTQILEFVETMGLPCEVLEAGDKELHVIISDPSSTFPVRLYVAARDGDATEDDLDGILRSANGAGKISQIIFIAANGPRPDLAKYAERRGISVLSIDGFRESFTRVTSSERYVVGALGAELLAKTYNVHEFYVEPNAVLSPLGDALDHRMLDRAESALGIIDKFLTDPERRLLFVFGGYGTGKSALCAHLISAHLPTLPQFSAAYVALRQIASSDDLPRVVAKAAQLARARRPSEVRTLVLLDGIDEIHNAMTPTERKKNILSILRSADKCDKMIITVRTSYFRGLDEFWSLFGRDEDHPLWSRMAKHLAEGRRRHTASALTLLDFNTDQVRQYVDSYAEKRELDDDFAATFVASMQDHDVSNYYRMIVRNPLYLFLILESRPWQSAGINCFGDIIEHLIKFWIARDIEKGQSRWLLSAEDRVDFMAFLCRQLFNEVTMSMEFDAFERAVEAFFRVKVGSRGLDALVMDLQTTGIFTTIRGKLYFLVPAFLDYFVSMWFLDNSEWGKGDVGRPARLPSVDQAKLWAGLAEVRQGRLDEFQMSGPFKDIVSSSDPRLLRNIELQARGALYGQHLESPWHAVNRPDMRNLRKMLNASFDQETDVSQGIRVMVRNWKGLHARAAAKLVMGFETWSAGFPADRHPSLAAFVRRLGDPDTVSVLSIMGLMMLGAGQDSVLVFTFQGCTLDEFEGFLRFLGMVPDGEAQNVWSLTFGESDPPRRIY